MKRLTQLAHEAISKVLKPGDTAVDLTAGNGLDTLFLARCVGPTGRVHAFDVQAMAITQSEMLLRKHGVEHWVSFHLSCHAEWARQLPAEEQNRLKAVMMNLGYLPGGDTAITTGVSSTLSAIRMALDYLMRGGILSIISYPGHPGGREEAEAVRSLLAELDRNAFHVTTVPPGLISHSPIWNLIRKPGS